MNILILDGDVNQAVACVRSLARAGHCVLAGSTKSSWKAGWSRYCHGTFRYPPPDSQPALFVRCVRDQIQHMRGAIVLPMTERTTIPISTRRQELIEVGGTLALPSHESVLRAFNKLEMTNVAKSIGVDTPRTVVLNGTETRASLASILSYPVVLKPHMSEEIRADHTIVTTSAPLYARNDKEFDLALAAIRRKASTVLAQEYVEGRSVGYFALMCDGSMYAEFCHERLRDVIPTGSGSSFRKSISVDSVVRSAGLGILSRIGWHGVAMVEFRVRPDGKPIFIEVNGRFWNSLALAVHAGIDFPLLLAEMVNGRLPDQPPAYAEGVHCKWLLGDFRNLLEVLLGPPRGFPKRYPTRSSAIRQFFTPQRGTFHDNFQRNDPLPELGDWLHFMFRTLPRRLSKSKEL